MAINNNLLLASGIIVANRYVTKIPLADIIATVFLCGIAPAAVGAGLSYFTAKSVLTSDIYKAASDGDFTDEEAAGALNRGQLYATIGMLAGPWLFALKK